jgi:hypothetical protein
MGALGRPWPALWQGDQHIDIAHREGPDYFTSVWAGNGTKPEPFPYGSRRAGKGIPATRVAGIPGSLPGKPKSKVFAGPGYTARLLVGDVHGSPGLGTRVSRVKGKLLVTDTVSAIFFSPL